jgi:hypothetical protein
MKQSSRVWMVYLRAVPPGWYYYSWVCRFITSIGFVVLALQLSLYPVLPMHKPNMNAPKVQIPRLIPLIPTTQPLKKCSSKSCAVACKSCRRRKIRCTGETPSCRNCSVYNVPCQYAKTRADRLREYVCYHTPLPGYFCPLHYEPMIAELEPP